MTRSGPTSSSSIRCWHIRSCQPADRRHAEGRQALSASESVIDLLPNPHIGRFVKEDGEVIDAV